MSIKYLRDQNGHFAGSVGTGKASVPTIADIPEQFRPAPIVENLPPRQRDDILGDAYTAWQAHETRNRINRLSTLWEGLPDGLDSWAFWNATDKMEYGTEPVPQDDKAYDEAASRTMLGVDQLDIVTDHTGATVGFVSRETLAGEHNQVDVDMWVHPAHRGKGIENRLVQDYTEEALTGDPDTRHFAHPHVDNTAMREALEAAGWEEAPHIYFNPRTSLYPEYVLIRR